MLAAEPRERFNDVQRPGSTRGGQRVTIAVNKQQRSRKGGA